jgi:uncharacterized short protein YbdD (DUF466 family)
VRPLASALRRGWLALRAITGDDAYERYLAHCRRAHPDRPAPDRRRFYLAELERRWRHVDRCC